jgi:hypothetical protein
MNYIQQAFQGKNEWYHWVITSVLVFFGWQVVGVIPLLVVAMRYSSDMNEFSKAAQDGFMNIGIESTFFLFLLIFMFAVGLLFLIFGLTYIHKRSVQSLVTSRAKIDWKRFWFGFITWGILVTVVIGIGILISPEQYTYNFKAGPFFGLLLVSFLFLPLQTSFEELLFRGYFMQGIGILVNNRWVPLLITSVCFGLLHGANPEVEKLGSISMVFYIGTGFFMGLPL